MGELPPASQRAETFSRLISCHIHIVVTTLSPRRVNQAKYNDPVWLTVHKNARDGTLLTPSQNISIPCWDVQHIFAVDMDGDGDDGTPL